MNTTKQVDHRVARMIVGDSPAQAQRFAMDWQQWQDTLTQDEKEVIAREVGLVDHNGNIATVTDKIASDFEKACNQAIAAKLA